MRAELTRVRAEAARLREDRERVLAAIDDPDSEPAAVIRALRDEVCSLETQIGGFAEQVTGLDADRAELEHRHGAELRAAEQRLARCAASSRTPGGARRRKRRRRSAASARRPSRRAGVRSRTPRRRTSARSRTPPPAHQRELAERDAAHRREREAADAAQAEAAARTAAARKEAETLGAELERLRVEAARLREERERVVAAVDDPQAEPATLIRALRAEVAALEGRLGALAAEGADVERRAAADAEALERRTAILERETEELRAAHTRELGDVRAAHQREIDSARTTAERSEAARLSATAEHAALAERLAVVERERDMLAAAREAMEAEREQWQASASLGADATASTHWTVETVVANDTQAAHRDAATGAVAASGASSERTATHARPAAEADVADGATAAGEEPPAALVEVGPHRLLERDPGLHETIAAALAKLPAAPQPIVVANLLAALPDRLDELDVAARAGAIVAGYAADGEGKSRLLGAVRWFSEPPSPDEAADALRDWGSSRRVITLSDDVDAFIPAKTALTRAGHSVAMACDTKQALDLLTMLTPHAVLVDLRAAPDAVAHFLDALELEKGAILSMLVLGEGSGRVLKRVVERLLRSRPLVAPDLMGMCRALVAGPTTSTKPPAQPARTLPAGRAPERAAREEALRPARHSQGPLSGYCT